LGLDASAVDKACAEAAQGEVVQAVNFNSPEQTVIAGNRAAVERAAEMCKTAGAKRAIMLPVSAPFHCSLMQPAAEKLRQRLASVSLSPARIPVINNVDVATVDSADAIRDALVRQAASPVRWVETMRAMQARGITHVFECGPGKVLAGLVKRCADGLVGGAINDKTGLAAVLAAVEG
jgi:[acyl-carrier-protein] S-malonyltransferase